MAWFVCKVAAPDGGQCWSSPDSDADEHYYRAFLSQEECSATQLTEARRMKTLQPAMQFLHAIRPETH
jgi:hypothetical protein